MTAYETGAGHIPRGWGTFDPAAWKLKITPPMKRIDTGVAYDGSQAGHHEGRRRVVGPGLTCDLREAKDRWRDSLQCRHRVAALLQMDEKNGVEEEKIGRAHV